MDDEEEDRRRSVANALRPVLDEGDAFNVYCHEGQVWVNEVDTSVCAARHPRLYGRLLALNAELDRAGSGVGRILVLLALTFCVGVYLRWWDELLERDIARWLDSFWFYLLVAYGVFQVWGLVSTRTESAIYRNEREDLLALMAEEGVDRDALLAMIEGDAAVSRVSGQLKLDREAAQPRAERGV